MKLQQGDYLILKNPPIGKREEWKPLLGNKFIVDNILSYGILIHSIKPIKLSYIHHDCTNYNSLIFSHKDINNYFEKHIESYWPDFL